MKILYYTNLSLRRKIYLSFSLLVLLFVINGLITMITLQKNKILAEHISEVVDPSMQALQDLKQMMQESKMYTTNWVHLRANQGDKEALIQIHKSAYAALKTRINGYSKQWTDQRFHDSLQKVYLNFESLMVIENKIMASLKKFEDYDDLIKRMEAERQIEDEVLPRTDAIMLVLGNIITYGNHLRAEENNRLQKSTIHLLGIVISLAITIFLLGLLMAIGMSRGIIGPINKIKSIVNDLGKGIIHKTDLVTQKDEIGQMLQAVNHLSEKTLVTTRFAYEVGKRNFNMNFQPLSEEDVLGKALLSMRDNLKTSELELQASTNDLHKKDELLQAVASATHELISNNDHEEAIGEAIRSLGLKLQVDIVNIYQNEGNILMEGYTSQVMRWKRLSNSIEYRNPEFQKLCGITNAFEKLAGNDIFHGFTCDLEDVLLKTIYENNNVKSVVAIPIQVMDEFWGFVSFNDCSLQRMWTETEFTILKSFAATLGATIERNQVERQLKEAKEKAEAASVAKSEFMANMSHELRTPMNGIIGFTELVLTTEMHKTQREYLQNVSKSAYNLLNIINDILDFSKIEAGKLIIDNTTFQLNEIIEETADILAIRAQEKNLEIICNIDPKLPIQFFGDAVRIRQILINLLGNAIKFTKKGEIFVTVQQGQRIYDKHGRKMVEIAISVKDTGIGIEKEKMGAIFESFTQADSSTTRKFGGTGLGLTISKCLAELMEGNLSVESEPGIGSTFTLNLVLQVIDEAARIAVPPKGLLRKVLVVDDNVTNCQLMQGIFEYLNIPCKICFNGPDALKIIEEARDNNELFDLIITDHQMPVMDGITLVREIKNLLSDSSEPFILMLSSLEKTMFQQEAENIGIDKFLSKPVKLNELVNLLSFLFEKSHLKKEPNINIPVLATFDDKIQVLVAEDNAMNMLLITEVLSNMGLDVIPAANGRETLRLLDQYDPAMIFMDVNMPGMDGFEATKAIRQLNSPKKNIPIIALTADAMKEDKERCLNVGMNDFVSKPFRLNEIESVLKKYLTKSPADTGISKNKEGISYFF